MERVRRWLERAWIPLLLVAGGVVMVLSFPHLASAYHLEAGGRALDDPPAALAHLQKALEWQPTNAQAYRLLSKVYHRLGDRPAEVAALKRFAEMRPGNPLAHIELAETYEAILAELASMYTLDLVTLFSEAEQQGSVVSAGRGYSQTETTSIANSITKGSVALAPSLTEPRAIVVQAPSVLTYTLHLPLEPALLLFAMGQDPQGDNAPAASLTFDVSVNGQQVFFEGYSETSGQQVRAKETVDLAPWAGQKVALTLAVMPAQDKDPIGSWAAWYTPKVVDARQLALLNLEPDSNLLAEWREAGLTWKDLLDRGASSRETGQYEDAIIWFQRAIQLEPDSGDPWYHIGQVYESQDRWQEALDAYERALMLGRFRLVGQSSVHYRMGLIYQRYSEPRQLEAGRLAYKEALAEADYDSKKDEAWTHARLGQVHFALTRDATTAESEFLKALELDPHDGWLCVVLGDLYRETGRQEDAADMYEQALQIDPDLKAAQQRLESLR